MQKAVRAKGFEVTGRLVLACLIGFFALIFAVNGVMVYAAKTTFGGVETTSSYKAGLFFNRDIVTAREQQSLGWQVEGRFVRDGSGDAVLDIMAKDRNGAPLGGLTALARLAHPADARQDHEITLSDRGGGRFRGATAAAAGQWELIVDFHRGEQRMFRSRSRIILK
ncbi:MAG: FixH family protein [Pseudolabrys sp.]